MVIHNAFTKQQKKEGKKKKKRLNMSQITRLQGPILNRSIAYKDLQTYKDLQFYFLKTFTK